MIEYMEHILNNKNTVEPPEVGGARAPTQSPLFILFHLTVYCLNGANAPRYPGCLSATSYGIETIKMTKP